MSPRIVWGGILGALAAYDLYCDRNARPGDTLSEVIRDAFRTHHPAGRVAFVAAWGVLSGWFVPHILRRAAHTSS